MKRNKKWIIGIIILLVAIVGLIFGIKIWNDKKNDVERTPVTGVNDIPGHRIGVQLGTTGDIYASDYEGDDEGTTLEKYTKSNDAILALKQDKVDCVIIDEQPALHFVKNNSELKILEEEFVTENYAICIAKGNDELKNKLNSALKQLKEEGTLENIISYYIDNEDGKISRYQQKDVDRTGTLVMATNAEFPPYEYVTGGGDVEGIDVDIAYAICDILGTNLKIDNIAFDSIIPAVSSGKADFGLAGMTVTDERLVNIDFSDSYTTSKQVIIVKDAEKAAENAGLKQRFYNDFIKDSRWKNLTRGLVNTLIITILSVAIGIFIGFIVAIIRSTYDRTGHLGILNFFAKIYLTVIRGTPAVVQLLIIYYVIFASVNVNKLVAAVLAFGINSGAYVAEIVRSGIMSIPKGQMEAGRSLGLNYGQTMRFIIMPQALKNVLPALANEFILLLKETSVAGYIGLMDLTRGGDNIRSITYDAFFPLMAVAAIYLVMVMILTALVNKLERRLRTDE